MLEMVIYGVSADVSVGKLFMGGVVPGLLMGVALMAMVVVVANREGSDLFVRELQDFTRERLAQHEFPRIVEFVSELPKNPAGKVHRKMLRDREAAKAAEGVN